MAIDYNAKLLMENAVDNAVITEATTGPATLPASHLQIYSNSRVYRSSSKSHTILKLTWEVPELISGIALWRHTLSDSATWQIQLFANPDFTSLSLDTGKLQAIEQKKLGEIDWLIDALVPSADKARLRASDFFDAEEHFVRSAIIEIWDDDNERDYIDITRLYLGRVISPTWNQDWGTTFELDSQSKQYRTAGGSVYSSNTGHGRKIKFTFSYLNESERSFLANGINHVGTVKDFYLSLYPRTGGQKEREYAFAAKLQRLPTLKNTSHQRFATSITVIEA